MRTKCKVCHVCDCLNVHDSDNCCGSKRLELEKELTKIRKSQNKIMVMLNHNKRP